jgi:hypothetical protein
MILMKCGECGSLFLIEFWMLMHQLERVRNRDAPWITSNIRDMMFRRDYLKKHAVKNRSEANWTEYCKLRNKVNVNI